MPAMTAPGNRVPHPDWIWGTENSGIAFAALGVPGIEVIPFNKKGWDEIQFAARYDLPALDEAFSSARIPGQKPEAAIIAATALSWDLLIGHWQRQSEWRQTHHAARR